MTPDEQVARQKQWADHHGDVFLAMMQRHDKELSDFIKETASDPGYEYGPTSMAVIVNYVGKFAAKFLLFSIDPPQLWEAFKTEIASELRAEGVDIPFPHRPNPLGFIDIDRQ